MLVHFGLHLAKTRKDLGWSQEGLANASGLARSYVSGIERGKRNLSLLNICKIADTLRVTLPTLMDFPRGRPSHVKAAGRSRTRQDTA